MKTLLSYTNRRTRVDVFMLAVALCGGSYFLLAALSILDSRSENEALVVVVVLLLFAGICLDGALFVYRRSVLPGFFRAACDAAKAANCEPLFIDACELTPGDTLAESAARMGLRHILRAFARATAHAPA